jgi:hypothetical protein
VDGSTTLSEVTSRSIPTVEQQSSSEKRRGNGEELIKAAHQKAHCSKKTFQVQNIRCGIYGQNEPVDP